ncbi:glycosyltransferase [Pedobacter sp. Du54]|uniref:glycosyltransferase n=1 Tax=Pedobacter anseongensis TaxID=3133439 RepID=UPI0030B25684
MTRLKKTILIISSSEIYHNPRLIKAADEFSKNGFEVVVWNILLGNISKNDFQLFINKKPWQVISFDISRNTLVGKINLFICSIVSKIGKFCWDKFKIKVGYNYYMSKGLFGFKIKFKPDAVYTNVIDTLPFSYKIAKRYNSVFCFDSQELFTGQHQNSGELFDWVNNSESEYMTKADIVLSTTNVMAEQIKLKYPSITEVITVRNLPNKLEKIVPKSPKAVLNLIWHGYAIYLNSRGVNLLIDGIKLCKTNVLLTLQGQISEKEQDKIYTYIGDDHKHLISFKPAAPVGEIVKSLLVYDIGLIGEQAENTNQLYTSSNKLFDYLHAGLPVIATKMPGLIETIEPHQVGYLYETAEELADRIDYLHQNNTEYTYLSKNATNFAQNNLWSNDFIKVIEAVNANYDDKNKVVNRIAR